MIIDRVVCVIRTKRYLGVGIAFPAIGAVGFGIGGLFNGMLKAVHGNPRLSYGRLSDLKDGAVQHVLDFVPIYLPTHTESWEVFFKSAEQLDILLYVPRPQPLRDELYRALVIYVEVNTDPTRVDQCNYWMEQIRICNEQQNGKKKPSRKKKDKPSDSCEKNETFSSCWNCIPRYWSRRVWNRGVVQRPATGRTRKPPFGVLRPFQVEG